MKIVLVAWSPYNRRSDQLAQALGAQPYFVHALQRGKRHQLPARYALQAARSWRILRRERPDVVFVQNPPIVCVLLVYLFCLLHGARFVIDSHTGAFLSAEWGWSLAIHRFLSRRAIATIITNSHLQAVVEAWGARALVIGYIPSAYPQGAPYPLGHGWNIAVVSTFAPDEPLATIFEAAARAPDVRFYVTGNQRRAAPELLAQLPPNVVLTGYIPYDQYVGLLSGVDAVLDLTTRDHTLLLGGFEAVGLGTPLIISDWPILRTYFSQGAVHVPNTADGICAGIRRAQRERDVLRGEVLALQRQLDGEWGDRSRALWRLLTP